MDLGTAVNWEDSLQHAEVSDIGLRRMTNQDAYAVVLASDMEAWQRSGHLFVVADGMGAHAAGRTGQRDGCRRDCTPLPQVPRSVSPRGTASGHPGNQRGSPSAWTGECRLPQHGHDRPACWLLLPQGALVAHVGDSRVYRVRGRVLEQLTFDHSLVWELREHGQFDQHADFANVVPKNIITRSLGPNPTVQTDFEGPFPLEVGDTFLLCSDGLTGPGSRRGNRSDPRHVCRRLKRLRR